MKLKPVNPKRSVKLDDEHATASGPIKSDKALERATKKQVKRISELQRVLYADGRYALLIVLQGRDASGKDGTIRKVFTAVNPQGCNVASFKVPTELEQRHDFLWRVHAQVPPRGMIGIFNRSHYEDVLVPRVHGSLTKKECFARYDEINSFEEMLSRNGVVILKFMLHVSRDEQRQRLLERLSDETKNWKFRVGDLEDRARWDEYTEAYEDALRHTSSKRAPWYIVPADDKDVRDWLVARTIADALDDMDLLYPPADPSVLALHFS
ncbi:MAG: polyphosphate kinase 2 family protein [Gemmatimonadota bacterium]|nr:polyphosphate kinase 2 family protein [Gemmatimonadota bacterium]